jgi:hypothetical protein
MEKLKILLIFLFISILITSCNTSIFRFFNGDLRDANKSKIAVEDSMFFSSNNVETLTLIYNAISCPCAQWSELKENKTEKKEKRYYWLEPADSTLINADQLFNGENLPVIIKVKGKVISNYGFPKRKVSKIDEVEAGIVFQYSKIKVIKVGK